MSKSNIFPIYFDAEPVILTADQTTYKATSSHIRLGTGVDIVSLLDADDIGTCIHFICTDSTTDATVIFATAAGGASKKKLTFAATSDGATVIWTPTGWRVVSMTGTTSIGTV